MLPAYTLVTSPKFFSAALAQRKGAQNILGCTHPSPHTPHHRAHALRSGPLTQHFKSLIRPTGFPRGLPPPGCHGELLDCTTTRPLAPGCVHVLFSSGLQSPLKGWGMPDCICPMAPSVLACPRSALLPARDIRP